VAAIYVSALQEGAPTELNSWAFLGLGDLGPMGLHLVACGDSAVTSLVPLLDVKLVAGIYRGSKESKLETGTVRVSVTSPRSSSQDQRLPYSFHRGRIALRTPRDRTVEDKAPRGLRPK